MFILCQTFRLCVISTSSLSFPFFFWLSFRSPIWTRACVWMLYTLSSNLSKRFVRDTQRNKVRPNLIEKWFTNANVYVARCERTIHLVRLIKLRDSSIAELSPCVDFHRCLISLDPPSRFIFLTKYACFEAFSFSAQKWLTLLIFHFVFTHVFGKSPDSERHV